MNNKQAALIAASALRPEGSVDECLAVAKELLARFLEGRKLYIDISRLTYEQGSHSTPAATQFEMDDEGKFTVQLVDNQQVTATLNARDSKGQPTNDTVEWSSDNENVVTVQPSDDGMSCLVVAGNPGTGAVVTATDGTLTATASFDVVPGGVATIDMTFGTPEDQPSANPTPTPEPTPAPADQPESF